MRHAAVAGIMHQQGEPQARRTPYMSIFPTKILLATDGSREAELAATTAADLAKSTGSELHVLYVGEAANPYVDVVELAGDEAVPARLEGELKRQFERQAREVLD